MNDFDSDISIAEEKQQSGQKAGLSPIFGDNMVLAAHKPIRFFGTGSGKVTLSWNGITKETVCRDNHWMVEFSPMEYGGPYQLIFKSDLFEQVLNGIEVGEVYMISGQSNMEFKLQESNEPIDQYRGNAKIRMYSNLRAAEGEYFFPEDGWVTLTQENAGFWSAIGYYTALDRQKTLTQANHFECAIGLITGYQGASVIESWIPENWLEEKKIFSDPEEYHLFHDPLARHHDLYHPEYSKWNGDGYLYHLIVEKTIPFSVNAVIWYQGESNTAEGESRLYRKKLEAMIDCWREKFMDPLMKFVIIQIANYTPRMDTGWINVQKAQLEIQKSRKQVVTVISGDVCETEEIHPPTKSILSHRVAESL